MTENLHGTGVTLPVRDRADPAADAALVERLGYTTIWVPGGQLDTLDRFDELLGATATVSIGASIIPAEVYDAETVAAKYAELEARHPGRFIAGIGGAQGPRPLRVLGEYLDRLDAAGVPRQARQLAALGPRKLELAARRAAGAQLTLVTADYTRIVRKAIGPDRTLVVVQPVAVTEDVETARTAARVPLRFLSGVRGYPENFARMGFSDTDIAELADPLVDGLVTWGEAAGIAERIGEHRAAGADQVAVSLLETGGELRDQWRLLAKVLN